jgi:hypothetical protein
LKSGSGCTSFGTDFHSYRDYVKACIVGKEVSRGSIDMKLIDQRYLRYKNMIRKYKDNEKQTMVVGGVARDA